MTGNVSWRFTATATSHTLVVVQVVDRTVIWAAGGGFTEGDGSVVRSVDGGRHWSRVTPPGGASPAFRDVHAVDANRALVLTMGSAARIYRTVDGGASWRETFANTDPAAFYDGMAFFDRRRGVAVSDAVDTTIPIQITGDGGRSWARVPAGGVAAGLPQEGPFATGTSLVAIGKRDALFVTTVPEHHPRVFRTRDGGLTWTVADTPIPRPGLRSVAFRNRHDGLGVGGTPPTEGTDGVGSAARTEDGGRTWQVTGAPTGFRNSVAWLSGRRAVAVGTPAAT
ncbi:MAG TPA: oxidoreductase [Actinoplanes sp.]|jgi:photosystem II stability/assembly factor-like uncharacterized protein